MNSRGISLLSPTAMTVAESNPPVGKCTIFHTIGITHSESWHNLYEAIHRKEIYFSGILFSGILCCMLKYFHTNMVRPPCEHRATRTHSLVLHCSLTPSPHSLFSPLCVSSGKDSFILFVKPVKLLNFAIQSTLFWSFQLFRCDNTMQIWSSYIFPWCFGPKVNLY